MLLHAYICISNAWFSAKQLKTSSSSSSAHHFMKRLAPMTIIDDQSILDSCNTPQDYQRYRVVGATGGIQADHPVICAILRRYAAQSKPSERVDGYKIALAIEGGGMRGCVSAGMTAAMIFLGLQDTIDVVYGSSAGAMIGAYFVSRQADGIQIYYNHLTAAGKRFINRAKLLQVLGLPRLWSRRGSINDQVEVFNLGFLLQDVMGELKGLDWDVFIANEKLQPLNIVTSSLKSFQSTILSADNHNYDDLDGLLRCIRASMSVPGVTGHVMGLSNQQPTPFSVNPSAISSYSPLNLDYLSDAFLVEPIPYRSAGRDNSTHVVVLRTKPDPCECLGSKGIGIYEKRIAKCFFQRYGRIFEPAIDYIMNMEHLRVYAEDCKLLFIVSLDRLINGFTFIVIRLNIAAKGPAEGVCIDGRHIHMLPIAYQSRTLPQKKQPKYREVGQLENRRHEILEGVRSGARRIIEVFLPAMLELNSDDRESLDEMIETAMEMIFHGSSSIAYGLDEDSIQDVSTQLKGRLIIK
jgi:predicted acylesterase/phospholipase RssA